MPRKRSLLQNYGTEFTTNITTFCR